MAVAAFFFMRKLVFDLVDEVWDQGSTLLIKNGGSQVQVPWPRSSTSATATSPTRPG
jgi:hypothetical protein